MNLLFAKNPMLAVFLVALTSFSIVSGYTILKDPDHNPFTRQLTSSQEMYSYFTGAAPYRQGETVGLKYTIVCGGAGTDWARDHYGEDCGALYVETKVTDAAGKVLLDERTYGLTVTCNWGGWCSRTILNSWVLPTDAVAGQWKIESKFRWDGGTTHSATNPIQETQIKTYEISPSTTCTEGWVCVDANTKGYMHSSCIVDQTQYCSYGCSNGECISCTPNWVTGAWGPCVSGTQARSVYDSNACGGVVGKPITTQICEAVCTPNWIIGAWGPCVSGIQTRTVTDASNCGVITGKPTATQTCIVEECLTGYHRVGDKCMPIIGDKLCVEGESKESPDCALPGWIPLTIILVGALILTTVAYFLVFRRRG